MTKRETVGQVLLMISGGRPTADMSVREADIISLLAPAINMAIDKGDNMNRGEDIERDYLSQFYATYENVKINNDSNPPFVSLEKGTVPLKGNAGIRAVYDNCGTFFGKLSDADRASVAYYSKITNCMKWYYRLGGKLLLYGTDPMTDTISYDALTSVEDLDDDDELPLVAGTEQDVLTNLYMLATGQIQNPYDSKIDHDDINKSPR